MKIIAIASSGGHQRELTGFLEKAKLNDVVYAIEGKNPLGYKLPSSRRNNKIIFIFNFLLLILKSLYIFIKEKPDAIITTGANTAVPICWLASKMNRRIYYIESIARITSKSKSGQIIEKYKNSRILVQWEELLKLYENAIFIGRILWKSTSL